MSQNNPPSLLLEDLFTFHNKYSALCGLQPFTNAVKLHVILLEICMGFAYCTSTVHLFLNGDQKLLFYIRCLVILPMSSQMVFKGNMLIQSLPGFNTVSIYLRQMYQEQQGHSQKHEFLVSTLKWLLIILKLLGIVYLLTGVGFFLQPFAVKFIFGYKLAPILPATMHFTTSDTSTGYLINFIHHFLCVVLTICGTWIFDTCLVIMVGHYYALQKIFICCLEDLDMMINDAAVKPGAIQKTCYDIFELHIKIKSLSIYIVQLRIEKCLDDFFSFHLVMFRISVLFMKIQFLLL